MTTSHGELSVEEPLPGRTIFHSLPGRLVTAVAMINGQLWLVIDNDKVHAVWHAKQLLAGLPGTDLGE